MISIDKSRNIGSFRSYFTWNYNKSCILDKLLQFLWNLHDITNSPFLPNVLPALLSAGWDVFLHAYRRSSKGLATSNNTLSSFIKPLVQTICLCSTAAGYVLAFLICRCKQLLNIWKDDWPTSIKKNIWFQESGYGACYER